MKASLEPEPQCIPGAAPDARLGNRFERDQRVLAERLAIERHPQRGDALPLGDRRDQRLLGGEPGLELAGLALGYGDQQIAPEAPPYRARRSFPGLDPLAPLAPP